ncbi:hypothetical protein RhiirB3_437978 [Rhizophagus irregularis]|nr:hypothetical protein RhiirB3_437978 [Rhizophagus irregularis]
MQLNYIKFNQKKICAELYNGFQNAMISGNDVSNVRQWIILPYLQVLLKHDLPHAYLLFILAQEYKPKTIDDYNTIISAEIPDENSNSNIFNTVKMSMI